MRWKRSAFNSGRSQPSVAIVFHKRSCTSGRRYKNPVPLGACNHLCGEDVYMSQPMSCTLSGIMPMTCAPSKALRIPLLRAKAAISFTGWTTPVTVLM